MDVYDEQTALSLVEVLAAQCGMEVVASNIERSELLETMPIVNLFVTMENPNATFASMRGLESLINKSWGGECRTGLYYADIGYDEVPSGQGQVQIDLLEFSLEPVPRQAAGPKP